MANVSSLDQRSFKAPKVFFKNKKKKLWRFEFCSKAVKLGNDVAAEVIQMRNMLTDETFTCLLAIKL